MCRQHQRGHIRVCVRDAVRAVLTIEHSGPLPSTLSRNGAEFARVHLDAFTGGNNTNTGRASGHVVNEDGRKPTCPCSCTYIPTMHPTKKRHEANSLHDERLSVDLLRGPCRRRPLDGDFRADLTYLERDVLDLHACHGATASGRRHQPRRDGRRRPDAAQTA